jgi:hypothetical protein
VLYLYQEGRQGNEGADMTKSIRILRNEHGDTMFEVWTERGRVERGDFEISYAAEILADHPEIRLLSMQVRGDYELWSACRDLASTHEIEYVNICG